MQQRPLPPRHTARADFPHPAFPDTFAAGHARSCTVCTSERCQAEGGQVSIIGHPFRKTEGPLAPSPQMRDQPTTHEAVDPPKAASRMPQSEVVRPAFQLAVQVRDQGRDRLPGETTTRLLPKLFPFSGLGLPRRLHMQVTVAASKAVTQKPERVA